MLDIHAWAWSLTGDTRLSAGAIKAMTQAEAVFATTISLFEIGRKVRLGKWPEIEPFLHRLIDLATEQGTCLAPLFSEASLLATTLKWGHQRSTTMDARPTGVGRASIVTANREGSSAPVAR